MSRKQVKLNKDWTWAAFKAAFVNFVKKEAVKLALKKLAITGGIKGWLVQFAVNHLIEAGDEYILEPLMVKMGYKRAVNEGKEVYEKVINAEDRDDWRNASRDI